MGKISGKIKEIENIVELETKKGNLLQYQDIVIDTAKYNQFTGDLMPSNYLPIRFLGEKIKQVENLNVGDMVEISYFLQGVPYSNGNKIFIVIRGMSATLLKEKKDENDIPF